MRFWWLEAGFSVDFSKFLAACMIALVVRLIGPTVYTILAQLVGIIWIIFVALIVFAVIFAVIAGVAVLVK